jgi:hypothetical protein
MRGLPSLIDREYILPVDALYNARYIKQLKPRPKAYLHPVVWKLFPFELPPAPRCEVL